MIKHLLLLVDGNLNERGVQERFFEAEGFSVATAASAEEALDEMASGPLPVLVISAVYLPGIDGFALCEHLRRQEATQEIPVILLSDQLLSARTPVDQLVVKQKLKLLDIALEDYLPKTVDLGALLDRVVFHITLIGRAQLTRAILEGATRTGRLEYLGILDLAQLFETSRLSGKVSFEMNGERAQLFFRDGQLIDARVGCLSELKAFFRLLSVTEGEFEIAFGEPGRPARIETPMQELIVEGQRRLNEIRWITMQLPPLDTALAFNFDLLSERLSEIPDEENGLLRLFDGKRTLREVLALTDFDELEALGIIGNLFFDGLLVHAMAEEVLPPLRLEGEQRSPRAMAFPQPEETPQPAPDAQTLPGEVPAMEDDPGMAATPPAELLFFEEGEDSDAPWSADARGRAGTTGQDPRHLHTQGWFRSAVGVQIGGAAADPEVAAREVSEDGEAAASVEVPASTAGDEASALAATGESQASAMDDDDDCGFFAKALDGAVAEPMPPTRSAPVPAPVNPIEDQVQAAAAACPPARAETAGAVHAVVDMSDQELMAALRPSRRRPLMILGGAALLGIGLFAGSLLSGKSTEPTSDRGAARGASPSPAASPTQPLPPAPASTQLTTSDARESEADRPAPEAAPVPTENAVAEVAAADPEERPATAAAAGDLPDVDGAPTQGLASPAPTSGRPSSAVPESEPTPTPAPLLTKTSAPAPVQPTPAASAQAPALKASAEPARDVPPVTEEGWEALIERGEALIDSELFSAAAKIFRQAVKQRPRDQRALSGLGRSLIDTNPNQAIRHLNRALQIDPTDALAWHDLGVAYQFSTPERPREALHAYEQFLKYAPSSEKPNAKEIRMIVKTLREEIGEP